MKRIEGEFLPGHHGLLNSERFAQLSRLKKTLTLASLRIRYLANPEARKQILTYLGSGDGFKEPMSLRDELTK